jgi:hypothetical protein
MLAYRSLCPSGWTTRWDEQRGKCNRNHGVWALSDEMDRGWYLPPQARPVDISLERGVACSDIVGFGKMGSGSGIGGLEYMYHIDRQQQCSSDSQIPMLNSIADATRD